MRVTMRLALAVFVVGCAESRSPATSPACSSSGPLLTPDDQRPILGVVFLAPDDAGPGCSAGVFNESAPESFVRDCAAYVAEASTCDALRARVMECRDIGLACGVLVPVGGP